MSAKPKSEVVRYVIRYRADAVHHPHAKWDPVTHKYNLGKPEPHPIRGHYLRAGGHTTPDMQQAAVFEETAATGRAFRPSVHELVQVRLELVRPTVYRGRK